jgi:hypothetical protein
MALVPDPDETAISDNGLALPDEKMPDGYKLAKTVKRNSFILQG